MTITKAIIDLLVWFIKFINNNPATVAKLTATGFTLIFAGCVAVPLLGAAGFTAGGVAAGSVAVKAQSSIGKVVAHVLFATLTSAAAGGYGVAFFNAIFRLADMVGFGDWIFAWVKRLFA